MDSKVAKDMRERAWKSGLAVWAAFVLVVVLLVLNAWYLRDGFAQVRAQQAWVDHTHEVIGELDLLVSALKDAETAQRGFQIAGEEEYLRPAESAEQQIPLSLVRLRALTADNPQQVEALARLERSARAMLVWLKGMIRARRQLGIEPARALFKQGEGKALMDAVRMDAKASRDFENELLAQRKEQAQAGAVSADRSFLISTAANFVLALASFVWFRNNLSRQMQERAQAGEEDWLRVGKIALAEATRGDFDVGPVCRAGLVSLASHVGASVGNVYTRTGGGLELSASFAAEDIGLAPVRQLVAEGQGLVGEAAAQRRTIHLRDVPQGYLRVASSTGAADAREIILLPLEHQGVLQGILELGSFASFDVIRKRFLEDTREMLGASIDAAHSRGRLRELLAETMNQASELQQQQEELRVSNEELEARAETVEQARSRLQQQQEELRQTNEELEQQTRALEAQAALLRQRNSDLDMARRATDEKASALAEAGRYKSEFLANMSHELRTPLNSLLLLATLLAENRSGHLDEREVEFAQTIHRAGNDLLGLINDVLDLAKVEAGKLELLEETVVTRELATALESLFCPLAEAKGISFAWEVEPDASATLVTDRQRLEQILRNLLSNAVKFTNAGGVTLTIRNADGDPKKIEFAVADTGIGINPSAQDTIFEAFRQADGSTSRQYGGTGLGLTISRELAQLLGGSIHLESEHGKGSTFFLTIPLEAAEVQTLPRAERLSGAAGNGFPTTADAASAETSAPDQGQEALQKVPAEGSAEALSARGNANGRKRLLVVEDDHDFAASVAALANASGFLALPVHSGKAALDALAAGDVEAVVLDVKLPDMSGLSVLHAIKEDPRTRHLPVHMISGVDRARDALKLGALGYLTKPVSPDVLRGVFDKIEGIIRRQVRRILVVEDDPVQRAAISNLVGGADVETVTVGLAADALVRLEAGDIDCMILDLRLPDLSGFELLERLEASGMKRLPPVVVYTGQDLSRTEIERLQNYAESIVLKGVRSPERLLDEVGLFLHRIEDPESRSKRVTLKSLNAKEESLAGRRILVVDDDMRNVYALVNALEARGMVTAVARDGHEALAKVTGAPAPELVLMDIMMPGMDGLEATRRIRAIPEFRKLPIIALTAKAMRGDHENCIEAGASDYLSKPVDLERLLSLLRVWLPKGDAF